MADLTGCPSAIPAAPLLVGREREQAMLREAFGGEVACDATARPTPPPCGGGR